MALRFQPTGLAPLFAQGQSVRFSLTAPQALRPLARFLLAQQLAQVLRPVQQRAQVLVLALQQQAQALALQQQALALALQQQARLWARAPPDRPSASR